MTVADNKKVAKPSPKAQVGGASGASSPAKGPESVDRIREIIFGAQMEDYEQRFARLEKRLVKESAEIRKDLVDRFKTLEKAMHREIAQLSKRLAAEGDSRSEATQKLAQQLGEEGRRLEEIIQTGSQHFDNLLQGAEKKAKALLQDRFDLVQQSIKELKGDKTDRAALAQVLRQAAEQLDGSKKS